MELTCSGELFLKVNKRVDQNKTGQGGFFSSKLINVHARLFGTLEYLMVFFQTSNSGNKSICNPSFDIEAIDKAI